MTRLRTFFRRHAALAILIVALAFAVRALVPAGYMTGTSATGLTVELCSGVAGRSVSIALPGPHDDRGHGKMQADSPCAFAGMAVGALGAVAPFLLAIALAFVALRALRTVPRRLPPARAHLRPPLRGPPLTA